MQRAEISGAGLQQEERYCVQCQQRKPPQAFSRPARNTQEPKLICRACEQFNRHERHRRVTAQRNMGQQEREKSKRQAWERRVALRQAQEQRLQERAHWYRQQPDRYCRMCRQLLPATAFGGISSDCGFLLHTRCMSCHEALRTRRQLACCLCQEQLPRRDFLCSYNGYALCGDGAWISLCCQRCESAFRALPAVRQESYIHACCQRSFPPSQVIYAEADPETGEIRYVGRTGKPGRRHAQHLSAISPTPAHWGAERKAWYTRRNWMYALAERGLTPSMQILQHVDVSPLVVEWEQRFIWHGIQQGWKLLNGETMDETLVARIKAARLDFLHAPFALLVQQQFFASHGLAAFLHTWHQAEVLAG